MRSAARALAAAFAAAAAFSAGLTTAAAGTPWGDSGARYSGGIVCALPGGVRVPMATWTVGGADVYALRDITERGGARDPAPVSGTAAPLTPGQDGLDGAAIAAAAYLLAHDAGTAADVAENSAELAIAAGDGQQQARCLGQQGTSARRAAARWARAQRFAGPYAIALGRPTPARPAAGQAPTSVSVTATVTSAVGAPTPGLIVRFAAGAQTASGRTDRSGVARVTLSSTAGPAAAPLVASVSEPTSLTVYDSDPPTVAPAAASTYQTTGALSIAAHPRPAVSVSADHQLLLAGGVLTPSATVTGTDGYSGNGTITLTGPARVAEATPCSSLTAAAFAGARTIWTGAFQFTGDATRSAGPAPPLAAGCYALAAAVQTTNSNPPAKASTGASPASAVTVSALSIATSTGPGVAGTGVLSATVTATGVGRATVQSALDEYGPVAGQDGSCDAVSWARAPMIGTSPMEDLAAASGAPGGSATATLRAAAVSRTGCYSLVARSTVTLDGHTLAVASAVGAKGSTVSVVSPTLTVSNGTYDGQQGSAMSGTLTVSGAYKFAGVVSVALVSAPVPVTGCHDAVFSADPQPLADTRPTIVDTTGDGAFQFVTPIARENRCYAVTAMLALSANPAVRTAWTVPSDTSIFLAGVQLDRLAAPDVPEGRGSTLAAAAITLGIAAALVLAVALIVIAGVAARRGRSAWSTFRPELRLDDELPESLPGDASRFSPGPVLRP